MANGHQNSDYAVQQKIDRMLSASPSYAHLDEPQRRELSGALSKIASYLGQDAGTSAVARQMAPDLMAQIGRGSQSGQAPAPAPGTLPAPAAPATGSGGSGPVGRVGEVARATLSAIDFPSFVASLISGTFQAIVDSSIQQMQAYAELLKNVASTVDRFMTDNITDEQAKDYLADQYGGLLTRDTSGGAPKLTVNQKQKNKEEIPSFFKDLGFNTADEIDDDSIQQVVIPSTRRFLAESRQRTLATMVLMGINRVVVDDGEIQAKLQFHIDASEAMQMRFDQTKTTVGSMSGRAGTNPFNAQAVMVNTASLNAQTDLNVRADLTGQVKVKFRSETFPLERFADSAAIQLINSNARVPQATPAPGAAPATPASPPVAGPAGPTAPAPPALAAPRQQSYEQSFEASDPWAPEA
jgi:hypothetical protein